MGKVLLLGDSIRISYQAKVKSLLDGKATLDFPAENCRFSAYTLFNLQSWATDDDYDVAHWNNGQWDTCYMPDGRIHTSLPAYVDLQKRIATVLQKKCKRLIFATTTPVQPGQYETAVQNGRKTEDIVLYNAAVIEALVPMGVEINDLFTPVSADVMTTISEDKVHLAPKGIELCARLVSEKIVG